MRVVKSVNTRAGSLAAWGLLLMSAVSLDSRMQGQAAPAQGASATPRQSGTVKAAADHDFVLTDAAGQDHAVTVPAGAKVLMVPPGSKDLSAATPGTLGDMQPGDRVLVTGKAGDSGPGITAVRVVVMKGAAIAQSHASDEAAWSAGTGGLVKSVDPATNVITLTSAARTITLLTTPGTVVRRYAGGSVRFEDATRSSLASVAPGDQLRARGTRSPDGSSFTADEIVTGSFHNYSGQIASIDSAAGMVTLRDLATKKPVTVAVSAQSNVRRLPPEIAAQFAARERAGAAAGARNGLGAASAASANSPAGAQRAVPPVGAPARISQSEAGSAAGSAASTTPGSATVVGGSAGTPRWNRGGAAGMGGGTRGGGDLSAMINRLPTETLAGLKVGEAVMIVASVAEGTTDRPTAITLLAGVEPILTAAPAGEAMTLSPWSVGGGTEGGEATAPQ